MMSSNWSVVSHLATAYTSMLSGFSRVQLCNLMDSSPPSASVHGIFQAGVSEWVAVPFSRPFPTQGSAKHSKTLGCHSLLTWQGVCPFPPPPLQPNFIPEPLTPQSSVTLTAFNRILQHNKVSASEPLACFPSPCPPPPPESRVLSH